MTREEQNRIVPESSIPEPGMLDAPDPEFDAAIERFIQMRQDKRWRRYCWAKGVDRLVLTPYGLFGE